MLAYKWKGNRMMEATLAPKPIQYLVEEDGQRVGVVLRNECNAT
jgi:hypothetical protein